MVQERCVEEWIGIRLRIRLAIVVRPNLLLTDDLGPHHVDARRRRIRIFALHAANIRIRSRPGKGRKCDDRSSVLSLSGFALCQPQVLLDHNVRQLI